MYSELSSNQQAALERQQCPHCFAQGNMRKVQTRTGESVLCTSCGKKVYKPRGRAVADNVGTAGGKATSAVEDGKEKQGGGESGSESKESGQGQQTTGQSVAKAEQKIGKPLSDAAKEAMNKIEQAVNEAVKEQLEKQKQEAAKQLEQAKQQQSEKLAEQLKREVEALRPKELIVKHVDQTGAEQQQTVPNAHPLLAEIIRRIQAGIRNFLLVGPSGSGKTTIFEQLAVALGVPYFAHVWGGGDTESVVRGKVTADGHYIMSPFVEALTQHAVFNNDELDSGDPNVTLCLNSSLAQNVLFVPSRGNGNSRIDRHKEHIMGATANTWGIGADMLFCGRNQLDAALKSRFACGVFFVDYDKQLEEQLVPEAGYRDLFWKIRDKVTEHKLRRVFGMRELLHGAKLIRAGYSVPETFKALTVGFSKEELTKVGIAA